MHHGVVSNIKGPSPRRPRDHQAFTRHPRPRPKLPLASTPENNPARDRVFR